MRVTLAGLFVFGALLLAVTLVSLIVPADASPALLGVAMSFLLLVLCGGALVLFNRPGTHPLGLSDPAQVVRELEAQGLLSGVDFRARRAFRIEEFEDEGSHYFIELEDGSVLFLSGQYLYDYELTEGDAEFDPERRFPCSEFTVRRHRDKGFVVDIQCRGRFLEPEVVARPFDREDYRQGRIPEDGDISSDRSYEAIKQERMSRNGKARG